MKNLKKLAFVALAIVSTQFYAQTKTGSVTYEMSMPDNEEMAAMGTNTIKISFNEKSSATQLDMMGGMISVKTISIDKNNPKETRILMEMMDKKYEVTGDAEETSAPVSIKLTHTEGDSLYDCLGRVLSLNTEFMSHATRTRFEADGKAIGEYDKEQTHVWWYTVKAKVTINPTFDAVCNRYSKTINYYFSNENKYEVLENVKLVRGNITSFKFNR